MDLFDDTGEPVADQDDMDEGREKALRELHGRWQELEARAEADPDDEEKARKADQARRAYEALREHHESVTYDPEHPND